MGERIMTTRIFRHLSYLTALAGIPAMLTACLGESPKRLGPNLNGSSQSSAGSTGASDNFVLQLALRDTSTSATNRSVVIQGRNTAQSNLFTTICGTDASRCKCAVFTSSDTTTPIYSTVNSVNAISNVFTCNIPTSTTTPPSSAGVSDADLGLVTYVRLSDTSGVNNSGLMRIKTQAVLADVLGTLTQGQIRKVYNYTCARTFLEGSGISAGTISCTAPGMALAALGATYSFYVYQQVDLSVDNLSSQGQNSYYNGGTLCGLQILRYSCSSNKTLKFGLAGIATTQFTVAITLTPAPDSTQQPIVGYAAKTDSNLNCPPGLVKITPYQAVPGTYTAASSNFINTNGNLNDYQIDVSTATPSNFQLQRQGPGGTCTAAGICPAPSGGVSIVQNTAYTQLSPALCAIPAAMITGL